MLKLVVKQIANILILIINHHNEVYFGILGTMCLRIYFSTHLNTAEEKAPYTVMSMCKTENETNVLADPNCAYQNAKDLFE